MYGADEEREIIGQSVLLPKTPQRAQAAIPSKGFSRKAGQLFSSSTSFSLEKNVGPPEKGCFKRSPNAKSLLPLRVFERSLPSQQLIPRLRRTKILEIKRLKGHEIFKGLRLIFVEKGLAHISG